MLPARGVDVIGRVLHLQNDSQIRVHRLVVLGVRRAPVRIGEQRVSQRERRPQRGAVEDASVALGLLALIVLGHHDEDGRGAVRAHAK